MRSALGMRVRTLRKAHAWNQAMLARRARVSIPYVSRIENDHAQSPNLTILRRMAAALGTTISDLVGDPR